MTYGEQGKAEVVEETAISVSSKQADAGQNAFAAAVGDTRKEEEECVHHPYYISMDLSRTCCFKRRTLGVGAGLLRPQREESKHRNEDVIGTKRRRFRCL